MNERLKEFFDFKNYTLKASIFLFILLVLNIFMWNLFFQSINIPFYTPLIIIVATFVLIYTILTRTKNKFKDESMLKYILKTDKDALGYLFIVYLIFLPLIFLFYYIIDSIINGLKNIPDTTLEIILIISGVVVALLIGAVIIGLIEWIIAKLNVKEVEDVVYQEPPIIPPYPPLTQERDQIEDIKIPLEVYYDSDVEPVQKSNLLLKKEQKDLIKKIKRKTKK